MNDEEAVSHYKLTATDTNEGLRGRWYPEYDSVQLDTLDRMRWSSWSNNKSFWVEKADLLHVMKQCGFDIVVEQFDCESDISRQYASTGFRGRQSRVFLVGIKSGM